MNAKFLSLEDRIKAIERVQENMTGIKNNIWKPKQSMEALLDVKVWLLVLIQLSAQIANDGITGVSISSFFYLSLLILRIMRAVRLYSNKRLRLYHPAHPSHPNARFRFPARRRRNVHDRLNVFYQRTHLLHGLEPRFIYRWCYNDPSDTSAADMRTILWILS